MEEDLFHIAEKFMKICKEVGGEVLAEGLPIIACRITDDYIIEFNVANGYTRVGLLDRPNPIIHYEGKLLDVTTEAPQNVIDVEKMGEAIESSIRETNIEKIGEAIEQSKSKVSSMIISSGTIYPKAMVLHGDFKYGLSKGKIHRIDILPMVIELGKT